MTIGFSHVEVTGDLSGQRMEKRELVHRSPSRPPGERGLILKNKDKEGFPGGTVVGSPPANAEDTGSCPGPGRSHMPRSGWAREPWPLRLRVRSLCSATEEATTTCVFTVTD